jgi:hypothetical protein
LLLHHHGEYIQACELTGPLDTKPGSAAHTESGEQRWSVTGESIMFDGANFRTENISDSISLPRKRDLAVKIRSSSTYPLAHAPDKVKRMLLERGRKFYECSRSKYVTEYAEGDSMTSVFPTLLNIYGDSNISVQAKPRSMADVQIYHMIHE